MLQSQQEGNSVLDYKYEVIKTTILKCLKESNSIIVIPKETLFQIQIENNFTRQF